MTDWSARVREVAFATVKLEDAYDMDQVDYLLDLLQVAADQGDPLAPVLEGVELNHVRVREGYAIAEVDAFFAEVRAAGGGVPAPHLSRGQLEASTAPLPGGPREAEPTRAEPTRAEHAEAEPTASSPGPSGAATVKRGLLARLFGRG